MTRRFWLFALSALMLGSVAAYKSLPLRGNVGKVLPSFTLEKLDGHRVDSYEFRGRWTLLSFFASWCVPCNQEMPRLVRDAKRYHLRVIAIDERDSRAAIARFVSRHHLPFEVMIDPPDRSLKAHDWRVAVYGPPGYFGVAEEAFMANALPGDLLVDPRGIVRAEWSTYDPRVDPLVKALSYSGRSPSK